MSQIGMVIKSWRTQNGLTQDEAAYVLDVSRQTINRWENGRNSPSSPGRPKKVLRYVYREEHQVRRPGRCKFATRPAGLELVNWPLENIFAYREQKRTELPNDMQFDFNHQYDGMTEAEKIEFDEKTS